MKKFFFWVFCVVAGVVFSGGYQIAAIALLPSGKPGTLEYVLLGPGILFAGPGFEAQSAVLPINFVIFAVLFTVVIYLLLRRKYLKRSK